MKLISRARDDLTAIITNDGVDCVYNGNTVKVLFLRDPEKNTDAYSEGVETATAFVYGTLTNFGSVKQGDLLTVAGINYRVSEIRKMDACVLIYVVRV